jgi:hypothetical protein
VPTSFAKRLGLQAGILNGEGCGKPKGMHWTRAQRFQFFQFLNLAGPILEVGLEKRQPNGNQKTEKRQKE